jgi:hypothetical protein
MIGFTTSPNPQKKATLRLKALLAELKKVWPAADDLGGEEMFAQGAAELIRGERHVFSLQKTLSGLTEMNQRMVKSVLAARDPVIIGLAQSAMLPLEVLAQQMANDKGHAELARKTLAEIEGWVHDVRSERSIYISYYQLTRGLLGVQKEDAELPAALARPLRTILSGPYTAEDVAAAFAAAENLVLTRRSKGGELSGAEVQRYARYASVLPVMLFIRHAPPALTDRWFEMRDDLQPFLNLLRFENLDEEPPKRGLHLPFIATAPTRWTRMKKVFRVGS